MKLNLLGAAFAALGLLLAPLALADTVTLKTGEKLEGKVTAETDQEVTIEYHVSASITDSRTIPKAEVESVSKASPDELIFQSLQTLKPGPNSPAPDFYVSAMKSLDSFLTQYPKSPHVTEVAQQLAALAEEKRKADSGQIKVAGQWLRREEAERERYQITGQLLLAQMQDDAKRGDVASAMTAFEQLEKGYPGSRAFPDAVELARQVLPTFKAIVDRDLQSLKTRKTQREQNLKLVPEAEKTQVLAAIAREEKQSNDALDAAMKGGLKLGPLISSSEKCLTQLSTKIPAEEKRLDVLPVPKMRQSIQASEAGLQSFNQGDYTTAQTSFREATTLWPANEIATRYTKEVAVKLAPKATPVPVVAAATPSGTPVQRSTPAAATPAPATPSAAKPAATPAPAPAIVAPPEEERSFFMSPSGLAIIVIVLALLGGAAYQARKKKKQPGDIDVE